MVAKGGLVTQLLWTSLVARRAALRASSRMDVIVGRRPRGSGSFGRTTVGAASEGAA